MLQQVKEFYMWAFDKPALTVELSPEALAAKTKAFLAHKSQYPAAKEVEAMLRMLGERVAYDAGLPLGALAEGFTPYF
jgi:LmbE family N-acetylglucosaminyl deacetylase